MPTDDLNFLTRGEIDDIVDHMTPRDLFAAMPKEQGVTAAGPEIAAQMFDAAAKRLGKGEQALDRVHMVDGVYLAERLGEVLTQGSPKDAKPSGKRPLRVSGG